MANLNQIVDSIRIKIDKPFDHTLREVLKDRVLQLRALLIRRSTQRHGLDEELKMSIDIPLIDVDKLDSCYKTLNCTSHRTINKVPVPVRLSRGVPFDFVGTLFNIPYGFIRFSEENFFTYIPIRKDMRGYYMNNGYIYLVNPLHEDTIRVRHVFENIEEAVSLCDSDCIDDNTDIFLPGDLTSEIINILVVEFLNNPKYRELEIKTNDDILSRHSKGD